MCVQKFTQIARFVHDLEHFVRNGAILHTSKPISANQDGIWNIGLIHLDHMTLEILSSDFDGFWTKSVGVVYTLSFAEYGLMVALQQAYVKTVGQRFCVGP